MAGGNAAASQHKTISPYDITSQDNPGLLITQVQLRGANYDEWARSLRTALRARKKFGFVDGTIEKPDDKSGKLEDWWTINSLLVSWIRNTIEPGLRSTISHVEVARNLWLTIKKRFSIANGPRIQQLKSELAECKQKGTSIMDYYGKLKRIWDELDDFEQLPTCKCGKCTCELNTTFEKRREDDKVHLFLMGSDVEEGEETKVPPPRFPNVHGVEVVLVMMIGGLVVVVAVGDCGGDAAAGAAELGEGGPPLDGGGFELR
ncbi:retrovirus-related Pol polyprotein from transposon TNT 1-94 [Senna tora]|uniref:Retrovirus-related Pol polyprotein from transposon TNT 1-94 n=1 Tax=Senna tora TaxID=362788 RepID=A0A834TBN4_9FABA|nr:retrovirus-related Pol polyprotein from transposon TNT 1-94 [Senna tora]